MAKLGALASRDSCAYVRGVLDKLMTHLFLVPNAVCAETNVLTDVDVVVGVVV